MLEMVSLGRVREHPPDELVADPPFSAEQGAVVHTQREARAVAIEQECVPIAAAAHQVREPSELDDRFSADEAAAESSAEPFPPLFEIPVEGRSWPIRHARFTKTAAVSGPGASQRERPRWTLSRDQVVAYW